MLMPLLRLMLHRAPKLTARTFYAPLNERSSFDELWKTARLIGKNVRRRKFIAKPYSTVKPELAEGWRLNLSACPLQRAPHEQWNNEIERAQLFLLFPHLKPK